MYFPMTKEGDNNPDTDLIYWTATLFGSEKLFIYFISDVPHLIKTAWNCLYNSGKGILKILFQTSVLRNIK